MSSATSSPRPARSARAAEALLGVLLLCLFVGLAWTAQSRKSATFDEPMHLLAGQLIAIGDYSVNFEHPPLVKRLYGWSGLAQGAELPADVAVWGGVTREGWPAAQRYLYQNKVSHTRLLRGARAVALALSTLLLIGVWMLGRTAFGPLGGLTTLAFLCGSPNLLGHAALANLDVALAGWLMLCCGCLWVAIDRDDRRWLIPGGLALGAALATKHSALLALPSIAVWLLIVRERARIRVDLLWLGLPALAMIAIACGSPTGLRWYGQGIAAFTEPTPRVARFLLGQILPAGKWYYFIVALGTKLPLPLLLLGFAGLTTGLIDPRTRPVLLLPAILSAVFVATFSLTGAQYGIRYVLIVVPTLALGIGALFVCRAPGRCARLSVVLAGLIWLGVGVAQSWPDYLAYFNAPSRRAGHQGLLLSDSNLDWGQDLPALSTVLAQRRPDRVYLAFFGTAAPSAHQIDARRLPGFGQFARPTQQPRRPGEAKQVLLAISISLLQGMFIAPPELYAWVIELPLVGRAGQSILVFDASSSAARAWIAATYWRARMWPQLIGEVREAGPATRQQILDAIHTTPSYDDAHGPYLLGSALMRAGDLGGAEFELLLAVAQGTRRISALYELALLYRRTGQLNKARQRVQQALATKLDAEQRQLFLRQLQELGH